MKIWGSKDDDKVDLGRRRPEKRFLSNRRPRFIYRDPEVRTGEVRGGVVVMIHIVGGLYGRALRGL